MSNRPVQPTESAVILSAKNLVKTFHKADNTIDVLKGVSLDIRVGDHISIVGQSGSGKSTFLQLLGILDAPTSGVLKIFDPSVQQDALIDPFAQSPAVIDSIRNHLVGFVFQFHHLLPDHTALRNVMMPLMIRGEATSVAQQQATEILARVGLGERLHHRPGELSGGEQQRVAIARALVHRPRLILADEPTGNLDPETAAEVMELLLELTAAVDGALVMVTHDLQLAARCDQQYRLVSGLLENQA